MPFPNEHAARQLDPSQFKDFRRVHPTGFPKGLDTIIGIKPNGKTAIQSLRFNRQLWTAARARQWLKEHNFKSILEEASKPIQKYVSWRDVL